MVLLESDVTSCAILWIAYISYVTVTSSYIYLNKQITLEHKTRILMNCDLFNIDFRWHGTILRAVNIGAFVIKILSKEPCVTRYVSYTVLLTVTNHLVKV